MRIQWPSLTFLYTSVAGYVGPDRFNFFCSGQPGFGTVFITVVAAPEPPTPTAPPTLPATGSTVGAGTVMLGGGLLFAGALLMALTRRRA